MWGKIKIIINDFSSNFLFFLQGQGLIFIFKMFHTFSEVFTQYLRNAKTVSSQINKNVCSLSDEVIQEGALGFKQVT